MMNNHHHHQMIRLKDEQVTTQKDYSPSLTTTTTKVNEIIKLTEQQQKEKETDKGSSSSSLSLSSSSLSESTINMDMMIKNFQIKETVEWIQKYNFKIIGLQFPDSLLPISVKIFKLIQFQLKTSFKKENQQEEEISSSLESSQPTSPKRKQSIELYVLADTSYGNCCVDVLAAQHISAQAIIHYGRACMSPVSQVSVFYVLPRFQLEDSVMVSLVTELCDSFERWIFNETVSPKDEIPRVLLKYDLGYHWKADEIFKAIKMKSDLDIELEVIKTEYVVGQGMEEGTLGMSKGFLNEGGELEEQKDGNEKKKKSSSSSSTRKVLIGYIGGNSARLRHIGMTEMDKGLITIDPERFPIKAESGEEARAKLMMKRYGTIQRARDADVYGLLIGKIGGVGEGVELNQDLELIKRTKELIEKRYSKKTYTISVGKIKMEKLGNFAEIECWIMFGCRENLLIEGGTRMLSDMVPVVTPWEAVIGLKSCFEESDQDLWSGSCYEERRLIDMLKGWIEEEKKKPDEEKEEEEEDLPVFSLATGQYKQRRRWKEKTDFDDEDPRKDGSSCLAINHNNLNNVDELIKVVGSAASEYDLVHRTFHGLDLNYQQHHHYVKPPHDSGGGGAAAVVEKGRIGIPSSYLNEPL